MGKRNRNRHNQQQSRQPKDPALTDWVTLELRRGSAIDPDVLHSELVQWRDITDAIAKFDDQHCRQKRIVRSYNEDVEITDITIDGTLYTDVRYVYVHLDPKKPPTEDPGWFHTHDKGWQQRSTTFNFTTDLEWEAHKACRPIAPDDVWDEQLWEQYQSDLADWWCGITPPKRPLALPPVFVPEIAEVTTEMVLPTPIVTAVTPDA